MKFSCYLCREIILEHKIQKTKTNLDANSGIRLFANSKCVITNFATVKLNKKKMRKFKVEQSDKANILKCKSITIDAEMIISQNDTIHWTNRKSKNPLIYTKLKNGTLINLNYS